MDVCWTDLPAAAPEVNLDHTIDNLKSWEGLGQTRNSSEATRFARRSWNGEM
jgi:hypothetical protein